MDQALSRGYLNEDFRMFHIRDKRDVRFDFHFHSFDKAIIFLSGRVAYYVEDKTYHLRPWDVLLVGHDQVHRPVIAADEVYDRVIFYVNPAYLAREAPLTDMFERAAQTRYNIIRPDTRERLALSEMYIALEGELRNPQFGAEALKGAIMTQIMITLNRVSLRGVAAGEINYVADPKISEIVEYILQNLSGELLIDKLAERFFVSPSFLMHRFREVTGYSPHNYITIKRMAQACELMLGGESATDAARQCGYADYSSFSRAYRKQYGVSPTQPIPHMRGDDLPMD
jgi:AraC-like DNA-binding protein